MQTQETISEISLCPPPHSQETMTDAADGIDSLASEFMASLRQINAPNKLMARRGHKEHESLEPGASVQTSRRSSGHNAALSLFVSSKL